MAVALPRLYAILDLEVASRQALDPLNVLDGWLDAGVRLVQLRAKSTPGKPFLETADAVVGRCRAAGAVLIINDRADIAKMSAADGVHLGQADLSPDEARRVVGPESIVGLSTHNHGQIAAAVTQPIDYLAIGPVFGTETKERPDPVVGLEGVRDAARIAGARGLPIVAIGGITLDVAPAVIEAGATSVAVIGDLLRANAYTRAAAYLQVL